jgi:hypothetical protein
MMLLRELGSVIDIVSEGVGVAEIKVEIGQRIEKAINYNTFTGPITIGDRVILNTTAQHLGLGTGGYHFVMHILDRNPGVIYKPGHIMKLRYTPFQFACLSVEEQASPFHEIMKKAEEIKHVPVICGSLHSMLPAAVAAVKERAGWKTRITYVMTDGAALPLELSKLVKTLRQNGLLDNTVTTGHAFGGDLEAVNIYSGILAARHVLRADVIIVCMGPGIVGTGTRFGFSGIELGEIINAVSVLKGIAIAIPRLSFSDTRPRHRGVSHHTLTALGKVAQNPAVLALPYLTRRQYLFVREQLQVGGVWQKHKIKIADGEKAFHVLQQLAINIETMGRGLQEEKLFFAAAAAAGVIAGGFCVAHAKEVHPG